MPYTADPELAAFVQLLPKTETHLHLEGAIPWELLARWDPQRFHTPPVSWADDFRFPSFEAFLELLSGLHQPWTTCLENYEKAAALVFARLHEQHVRYVETSFDAFTCCASGIDGAALVRAIKSAAPEELAVRVFMGIFRDGHETAVRAMAEAALEWEELDGIDIHDIEIRPFADWIPAYYREARRRGKFTKAHAGEFGDAGYVREAVERLELNRIEHGIHAVEDPAVVRLLLEADATLDICPISNVKLGAVPSMRRHPIRELQERGVRCTVSTDDPLVFGNRLSEEYFALHHELGFDRRALLQIARNGWHVALLDETEKAPFLQQLKAIEADLP